ncbi:KGG domain-containing protein [Chloroflexota bacterium]
MLYRHNPPDEQQEAGRK